MSNGLYKPVPWPVALHRIHPMFRSLRVGLVGHWVMWEGSGLPRDISGFGKHAIVNTGIWSSSERGRIITLDGGTQDIAMGLHALHDVGNADFTMAIWERGRGTSSLESIFGKIRFGVDEFGIHQQSGIRGRWRDGGAATIVIATTTFVAERWYHITFRRRGSTFTIYVNGLPEAEGTEASTSQGTSARILAIGRRDTDQSFNFTGDVDDARLYNRALLDQEIMLLHAYPYGDITPWWSPAMRHVAAVAAGGPAAGSLQQLGVGR